MRAHMKRVRLDRWASQLQPSRNPRLNQCRSISHDAPRRPSCTRHITSRHLSLSLRRATSGQRNASSAAAVQGRDAFGAESLADLEGATATRPLNAPSYRRAIQSAKLSALHARLSLPAKLPLQTLARCLIDPSVDSRPGYNNAPFALLGQDLLGYHTAEYLMCKYPRLPMPVVFAAQYAYVGSATLAAMRAEWGVEAVAAPGPEVDGGLLQLTRVTPGNSLVEGTNTRLKDMPKEKRLGSGRANEQWNYRRGMSSRIVYDDQFGDLRADVAPGVQALPFHDYPLSSTSATGEQSATTTDQEGESSQGQDAVHFGLRNHNVLEKPTTLEAASASFVRALTGALYLHAGSAAVKAFHKDHVLSRHFQLHKLFNFTHPTRDLSRLCARENFEPPVARLLSETGRLSRTPVFVVGVFSGEDKLGEGAGASLDEGRIRAAAAALRSWYLYSPPESEVVLPSDVEGASNSREGARKRWKPQMIDVGEVIT